MRKISIQAKIRMKSRREIYCEFPAQRAYAEREGLS